MSPAPAPRLRPWRYRASDATGSEQRGEVQAESEAAAVAVLRARTLWVIDLEPLEATGVASALRSRATTGASKPALLAPVVRAWARWSGQDLEALAVMMRAGATLLAAGVPLERTLDQITSAADGPWADTFASLRAAVHRGASLAEAAAAEAAAAEVAAAEAVSGDAVTTGAMASRPSLPASFGPAFAAAEASGSLAATFERLAHFLERQVRTAHAIRAALVYPAVLGLASALGTLVMLLVVVPRFATLLTDTGVPLPWATRALVALGSAVSQHGLWLLTAAVAFAVVVPQWLRSTRGRQWWHAARLAWPVVGPLERARETARYLETLALSLGHGVPVLRAMALARQAVLNDTLAEALEPAEGAVRDGRALSAALETWLPPLARQLLMAGEAAGALAPMAQRAADAADAAVQRRVSQLVAIVEPVLILGFGAIVAFVALALLQAIYGLNAGQL